MMLLCSLSILAFAAILAVCVLSSRISRMEER